MPQGVCMFDGAKRLVFCNRHYADLYALPLELTEPGTPLIDILEHRIKTGSFAADRKKYISDRMKSVAGSGRRFETIEQNDGRAIQILFYPLASGGWVATHVDVTRQRHAEASVASRAGVTPARLGRVLEIRSQSIDAMPHAYQFTMHDAGVRFEFLDSREFADDGEAFAFGERMLQDVMRTDADRYPGSGWVMDISEGEGDRAVARIPFILAPGA